MRFVKGTCHTKECGAEVKFDIGVLPLEKALEVLQERTGYECPGLDGLTPHVELGNIWGGYDWVLDPEGQLLIQEDETKLLSDQEFLDQLKKDYPNREIVLISRDPNFPELRSFDEVDTGISHLGFGEFSGDIYNFSRKDTPSHKRFYVLSPKVYLPESKKASVG